MSPRGVDILGVSLDEIKAMSTEYYDRFFKPEETAYYVPKIQELLKRNDLNGIVSYFQQVRSAKTNKWGWYTVCSNILLRDDDGQPILLLTIDIPIDEQHHLAEKIVRLTEENTFLKERHDNYAKLGKREREILRHLALGKNSVEIAEELYISISTVKTHRRNIRKKLKPETNADLWHYAELSI